MARYTTGYEDIMVSSTAIGFTAETAGTAKRARVQVEDAPIRVRVDGTDPTASVGELFTPGDSFVVEGDLTAFAAICADGDDATLRVTYDTVTPAAVASIIRESPTAHSVGHQSMSVTIENGAALSDIIDFREKIIMQIHMPDGWRLVASMTITACW